MSETSKLKVEDELPLHTHPELMLNMEKPQMERFLCSQVPYVVERLEVSSTGLTEIDLDHKAYHQTS